MDGAMEWTINRLAELHSEYAAGNAQLAELARRRDEVRAAVTRIEGAIRVLEEQVAQAPEFAQRADVSVG